ncbi:MAG: aldolase/citrate lyase family protein [Anaerolineae bacterium]
MQRAKSLKENLQNNIPTIGSWLQLGSSTVAEIMVHCGFDWLVIDLEHSVTALAQAQEMIRVIDLAGCVPLVRVSTNDPTLIKRVMDAGAYGVIVPMVNSAQEALAAVSAIRYPPTGTRGVGLWRAQGYGMSFAEYQEWLEHESVLVVQIEHIRAVENIEGILAVPGVDAFIIGPYDLSGSLGVPGELEHPDVVGALARVEDVARRMGKTAGYHVVDIRPEPVLEKLAAGYHFLAYGADMLFLAGAARAGMGVLWESIAAR